MSERFREPGAVYLSPDRIAAFFEVSLEDIAADAGVSLGTIRAQPTSPLVQAYLRDLVRVLSAATALTGDACRAAALVRREALRVFGDRTAAQLVADGRTDDVVAYLDSLSPGAAG